MRVVKLTPKAEDDLEAIWHYDWQHFGEAQADKYTDNLSAIFQLQGDSHIGIHRPEMGRGYCCIRYCSLPGHYALTYK
ncbi:type II toxin-antitoxin system RelE/ParE family toxin [Salmonella enterica]|nr:type II toxin-antitoxin system RelE/ParE family toxin [Salmonella enterica subsp. enterica]EBE6791281.1 type II toxin-antitoxin system RelE/ParE family toxin [Salmonella enterica]EBV0540183.1 type II toxin-antitoxin system RelE/ParE family toxin [Salmonella enterica subsp. enterica serovar Glostrup]EEO9936434.1 type II toxin-antitoxin system RelE/ParE family toxin [Salmonella enterica subsp. enterica serovar Sandiego]EBR5511521.1 type II toxin-antitoxin system RelE/ParE family toxin [Salmone